MCMSEEGPAHVRLSRALHRRLEDGDLGWTNNGRRGCKTKSNAPWPWPAAVPRNLISSRMVCVLAMRQPQSPRHNVLNSSMLTLESCNTRQWNPANKFQVMSEPVIVDKGLTTDSLRRYNFTTLLGRMCRCHAHRSRPVGNSHSVTPHRISEMIERYRLFAKLLGWFGLE
jgi:hypothetical protein